MRQHFVFLLILLLTFSGSLCLAQTSGPTIKEDFKPATSNQPGKDECVPVFQHLKLIEYSWILVP